MYLTGELTVKYLSPVPVGEPIGIVSRLQEDSGRIAYSTGELVCGSRVCVRAKGKFLPMSREETGRVLSYLKFDLCRKYRSLFDYARETE